VIEAWRISKERHVRKDPLSGEGARRFPGRWHPRGVPVVYTSSSLSLAALETFVHLPAAAYLPGDLVSVRIVIPDGVSARRVEEVDLPKDWAAAHPVSATQAAGAGWVQEAETCVLDVPSAVTPTERNYLLNPAHPDFASIGVTDIQPFQFDPRMRKH
jgi:RES domain-containing protein